MNELAKLVPILFYSSEEITIKSLLENLSMDRGAFDQLMKEANKELGKMGLIIISEDKTVQLVAKPEYTNIIDEFYDSTPQSLSQPALETLSVIAYKQPIAKGEIDEIRGISSEQSIRNLLNRNLIKKISSKNSTKYKTTSEFIKLMGIESIKDLEGYEHTNK